MSADAAGGVWDYAATVSRALAENGHDVRLAILGSPSLVQLAQLSPSVAWSAEDLRLEWMPGGLDDVPAASKWIAAEAERWNADVVHLNQLCCVPECGVPTVLVAHSDVLSWYEEARRERAPARWREYAGAVRRGLGSADLVVTPSAYQSELLRRHYGRAADRVIWNAVSGDELTAGDPSPPDVGSARPLVLAVGRAWDEAKGAAVLDRALALLGDNAPEASLLGATVGPYGERFEATKLRARGHVGRSEVDAWMRRADIFVGASLYEPFGLAPLEAARHGCALVLSSIGSFRELWHGCAAFFPAGDAEALAHVLRHLSLRPRAREELAARAGARARECFTSERLSGEYLDAYAAARAAADDRDAAIPAAGAA